MKSKTDVCVQCGSNSIVKSVDEEQYMSYEKTDPREFDNGEHVYVCVFCQGLVDRSSFGVEEFEQYFDDVDDESMRDIDAL